MAKILAKILPSAAERLTKLRQTYEWTEIELDSLEERYEEIKAKKLKKKLRAISKKHANAEFMACDKSEYLDKKNAKKLREFDIKNYLSYREANHSVAKEIFGSIKKNKKWNGELKALAGKIRAVKGKRASYVAKLESSKNLWLKLLPKGNENRYARVHEKMNREYVAYKAKLDRKYARLLDANEAKLERKLKGYDGQLNRIVSAGKNRKNKLPSDTVLSVKGLKMYFGGLKAVDDLSFDVKKGEIFGLIGPNGAGKTTVFNCITQFYKPTGGELLFATKDGETVSLTDYKVHDIVLQGIARTFQNIEVVKEVSVLDNLLIAATRNYTSSLWTQMLHLPKLKREEKVLRARADKVLKYMGLESYRDRLAWGLPYGILKRIEIARALMCNPHLIILDEPAAGLNDSETAELAELINKIRKDFGTTVLLVEHDMSLVMKICDHICAISFGKKLAYGTPAEVQASKEVQEAYLGVGG